MDFAKLITDRYSVRSFDSRPIEEEKLQQILEAGRIAPTACNNQPQRVKVISSAEDIKKFDDCSPCRFGAPTVLLVCYDKKKSWIRKFDSADMGTVDAAIVTTHLMLQAEELGLGSVWIGYFDPQKIIENFQLPENIVPIAVLPLGYKSKDAAPAPLHTDKESMENMLLP